MWQWSDNQDYKNGGFSKKAKQIKIRKNFAKGRFEEDALFLFLRYFQSKVNPADILTNALLRPHFETPRSQPNIASGLSVPSEGGVNYSSGTKSADWQLLRVIHKFGEPALADQFSGLNGIIIGSRSNITPFPRPVLIMQWFRNLPSRIEAYLAPV